MAEQHERLMRRAIELAALARANGNHPFGALIVNQAGDIILEAENTVVTEKDCTCHAETNLLRKASKTLPREEILQGTLYTSTEPCAMCAGAFYWSGFKKLVFGLRESELYKLTGTSDEVLEIPCKDVFKCGQRDIEVVGPILEDEARKVHEGFWV